LNREEKAALVKEIAAQIEAADAIFAIDYRGISVPEAAELRSRLREADASFRVVKNRLTKLAADKAGRDELKELLDGPTALTFVSGDSATAAKAISTFSREHDVLAFKGGFMDGVTLDEDQFTTIARLPALDVLHGQFAGVVASPLTGLVRGLNSMISGLAIQLQQIAEQGLVSGAPPAGPVAEEDPSSSQAADEEPTSTQPAEEASAEAPTEEPEPEEAGEAPADEPPTESEAAAGTPAEDDPSQAEGEEPAGTPGSEAEDVPGSDDQTSDDSSNEEE
jgi:large subunit ribosomal protein L10